MLDKFYKELEYIGDFNGCKRVVVAVSGGSDSLALVFLINNWAKDNKCDVVALTVNHNLRNDSLEEAKEVGEMLAQHNIEHHILEWAHDGINSNIQSQAREARLGLLSGYCKANKIKYLFIAHTKNDVAENFLIRSIRGSGIYGLSSMSSNNIYKGVAVLKPLLNFTKYELQAYLKGRKIKWLEDPSNKNLKFLRTKIRKLLESKEMQFIEDMDLVVDRLALSANNLARARSYIEEQAAKNIEHIVKIFPEGYIIINKEKFCKLHEELGLYILSHCLMIVSGKHCYKPRLTSLEVVYGMILSNKQTTKTLWECEIKAKESEVCIYREIPKNGCRLERVYENNWIWDSRFEIKSQNNVAIKHIGKVDFDKINEYNKDKFKLLHRKIWSTLPQISLEDGRILLPYLHDLEKFGINVSFSPRYTSKNMI